MIFFIAGILQDNMFFVIPIHFRTYTKHFRRFLTSFWSSAEQRWFRENQRWTALKQRWSALVFLTHSETALISAEIFEISETTLFSADFLWDFNPGIPVGSFFWIQFPMIESVWGEIKRKILNCKLRVRTLVFLFVFLMVSLKFIKTSQHRGQDNKALIVIFTYFFTYTILRIVEILLQ